jgi:hypothetical protein
MLSMFSNDTKAYFETETKDRIPCLFNPASVSMSLGAAWDDEDDDEELQYSGENAPTMSFELMFDTTQEGKATPVTKYTSKLIGLTRETDIAGTSAAANDERPEWVRFCWGKFVSFKAVVKSLELNFTLFNADGVPLRATASVTLQRFKDDKAWPKQNPTSGTPAPARNHVVQPGETLDRVANTYLADPNEWRALAAANNIRDPFALRPGRQISIPRQDA